MPPFGYDLLWNVAAAKIVLAASVVAAVVMIRFKTKPAWYVALFGAATAFEYLFFVHGAGLMFWGIKGDEQFVAAFLETVAAGHPFRDLTYAALPPFYPPLYFWIVGGIAWVFSWNGVQAAKLGTALSFALLPIGSFFLQKRLWRSEKDDVRPSEWGLTLASLAFLPALTWDAAVIKPYETVTALLGVQIGAFFLARSGDGLVWRSRIGYGAFFALLLATYYFWGFQLAIAAAIVFAVTKVGRMTRLREYPIAAAIALIGSSLFWLPYVLSFRYGFAPQQATFLFEQDFDSFLPFLRFTPIGLLLAFGVVALAYFRKERVFRALAALALAPVIWQTTGILVFAFGGRPPIPSKPLLYFGTAALVTAAGWGVGRLRGDKWPSYLKTAVVVVAVVLAAAYSFAGTFIDDPLIRAAMFGMRSGSARVAGLVAAFDSDKTLLAKTYLSSGLPDLSAFEPLDLFIQPTIHFSHPAADWPRRAEYLERLAESGSADEFADSLAHAPWGPVDGLILYRQADSFVIYLQDDAWPDGTKDRTIAFPVSLVDAAHWDTRTSIGNITLYVRHP